jgi:hypothetical protein
MEQIICPVFYDPNTQQIIYQVFAHSIPQFTPVVEQNANQTPPTQTQSITQLPELKEVSSEETSPKVKSDSDSSITDRDYSPTSPNSEESQPPTPKRERKSPRKGTKRKREDDTKPYVRDDKCKPNPRINLPIFEVGKEIIVMDEPYKWEKGIIIYRYGHMYTVKLLKSGYKIPVSPYDIWDYKRNTNWKHPKVDYS